VKDGVDSPLASLFVHVARPVPPDAEGAQRARSASEAFLFRRLETLPGYEGSVRCRHEVAHSVRWRREPGERSLVCGRSRGSGAGWCAASRPSYRVPARPAEGPTASGERISRVAVSRRRPWQGSGRGARRDSPRDEPSRIVRVCGSASLHSMGRA